ncbi:glycosyltransferase family 2 protein [Blautia sp. MSJ-19]|uniref:glycosyltransferase family 2 protein n=1 Tax=Blautia sp. MSJ-19 TaxID=2841517 RepID=UPI001C0F0924|nr:glycosyltransferase [Blautia sp. MSJ-19]MBU5480117.1 glycosyltransferase [Blautia sp. MSJ-19]
MDELISIIIPVYNVEKYLRQCVDTVLNQTYRNIEIILVDDGATDTCPQICDDYEKLDARVRVIHKVNGGLSDARNAGLHIAQGKYVCFFDSDDAVSIHIVEELYRACAENDADTSVCYYQKFTDSYSDIDAKDMGHRICTGKDLISEIYAGKGEKIAFVAWNKLYKKSLFEEHGILYPYRKQHEDIYTTYKLLYHSKKVCIVEGEMYYYRVRSGSIMNSKFSEKRLDAIEARMQTIEFYRDQNEKELQKMAVNDYFGSAIKIYDESSKRNDREGHKKIKRRILSDYKKVWRQYGQLTQGIKKLFYRCFFIAPDMVSACYLKLKR